MLIAVKSRSIPVKTVLSFTADVINIFEYLAQDEASMLLRRYYEHGGRQTLHQGIG